MAPIEPVVRPVGFSPGARASDAGDAKPASMPDASLSSGSGSRNHNLIASANCSSPNSVARTPASNGACNPEREPSRGPPVGRSWLVGQPWGVNLIVSEAV